MVERGALELARTRTEPIIARLPTAVTAFVGRTLKGPVQRPVTVTSFAEFQLVFGGLWQPAPISYAVEQFFDHGGGRAIIVRVANGARPPTIRLPAAAAGMLRLAGVNPGSREYLRASVDYDGIPEGDADRFNLVIQRVRSTGSELIEDQEIYRRASLRPDAAGRSLADLLLQSRLVRAVGPLPTERPDRSAGTGGSGVGYAFSNADGDDGGPLTDYDIIGSAAAATGLFALSAAEGFNFLCIPPLSRDQDLGLSSLLVAARYCRERHAMLIVDPPASWATARAALDGMRGWPFRSDNAVMYYPRVQTLDRLRGRLETFASCGAVAGMLARADEIFPLWSAESREMSLRPGTQPAIAVVDADRLRLAQVGINTLSAPRTALGGGGIHVDARTLAAGGSGFTDWKYLSARRLGLWISASIERGTRWVLLEQNGPATWARARSLVATFLEVLAEQGAFAGAGAGDRHFVICDERVNRTDTIADGRVNLLFGFATGRPGEFDAWLVTHHPAASRVRPVSVNRLATSRQRVEWEIETAILKKMDYR